MARTNKYTERRRKGIVTPYGQWLYPGQVTTIPGSNITMRGVPYPVLGVSDKGDAKMMMPGMDYLFKGNEVTEYPMMQKGGFGRKRVEKNGMEYLKDTDGYTGVVQKQTQHGLGVSRRYDAPVYQYYDNGNPVGESWRGAGDFQNDIVKDYESEPVAPLSRKYSNYDPNSLTYFKDLATGETPFKQYVRPEMQALLDYRLPITENPSQTRIGYSVPRYTPSVSQPIYIDNENKPSDYLEIIDNPTGGKYEQFVQYFYPRLNNYLLENYPQYYNRDLVKWMTAQTAGESGYDVNPSQYNRWGLQKNKQNISYNSLNDAIRAYFSSLEHNFPNAFTAKSVDEYEKALYHNGKRYHESGDYGLKNYKTLYNTIDQLYPSMQTGGKIHIKEKNRGKFTEAAQRAGKSVQAYAAQILANKGNYSPALIKRANFARNSAKWKHQSGGVPKFLEGNYFQPKTVDSFMGAWNDQLAKRLAKGDMIANHVDNALNAVATASAAASTQFGKDFTRDIMAVQGDKQTSVAAPKSEVKFDLDEDLLKTSQEMEAADYIEEPVSPSVIMYDKMYDRNQQLLNQQVPMTAPRPYVDTRKQWFFDPRQINVEFGKFAAGGKLAPNAEIEYGEIAETVGGAEQANGNTNYHISMTDKNETTKNQVTFTNNIHEDVKNNPQLTKLPVRENKYTNARRKGIPYVQVGGMIKQVPFYNEYALMNGTDGKKKTFLYPSTVTIGGRITEPVDRTHYPLAEYINQKFLS